MGGAKILNEDGQLLSPPIWADLQAPDLPDGRMDLNRPNIVSALADHGIVLFDGMPILLYGEDGDEHGRIDDLVVVGTVEFDVVGSRWLAKVDWESFLHVSELTDREVQAYRAYRPQIGRLIPPTQGSSDK